MKATHAVCNLLKSMRSYTPRGNCRAAKKRQIFICSSVKIFVGEEAKSWPLPNQNHAGKLITLYTTLMFCSSRVS